MKQKYLIKNINYSDKVFAKKMIRRVTFSDIICYLTYFLITIIYISLAFIKIRTSVLLLISIFYISFIIDIILLQRIYRRRIIKEAINVSICPEAFLDLNLYNAKKILCKEKDFKYYLSNIAKAYILLGNIEKATEIIKQIDKDKKNMLVQGELLQNKIEIAFIKKDIKEFNYQYEKLNNILKFISKRYREEFRINCKYKKAVLEKNINEVNKLCEQDTKNKNKYNNVMKAYYKGIVLEENNKENYEEYFQYVADNGNNLYIADQTRKKMKITKTEYIYQKKNHLIYNLFKFITFIITLSVFFIWIPYLIKHL